MQDAHRTTLSPTAAMPVPLSPLIMPQPLTHHTIRHRAMNTRAAVLVHACVCTWCVRSVCRHSWHGLPQQELHFDMARWWAKGKGAWTGWPASQPCIQDNKVESVENQTYKHSAWVGTAANQPPQLRRHNTQQHVHSRCVPQGL